MTKRLHNPRKAKIHRAYKVDEVSKLYEVHKNTVLNWIKKGLPTLDSKKPLMILGSELNAFHAKRRREIKQPCQPNQIYCMRCRCPQIPKSKQVAYKTIDNKTANLVGKCPRCNSLIYRRVSLSKIDQFSAVWNIQLPQAKQHIVNTV